MVGQRAIGEIAVPEIAEFGVVEFSLEHSRLRPSVHLLADTIGAGEIAHDLGFEEAPQEGEVEDGAAVRIGKIPEARRARLEPLLAHAALRCLIVTDRHGSIVRFFAAGSSSEKSVSVSQRMQ